MAAPRFSYGPLITVRDPDRVEGTEEAAPSGREDGRDKNELRPLFLQTRVVSQATGSAYLEAGKSKVICSVYGPTSLTGGRAEVTESGRLSCELKWTKFARPDGKSREQQHRTVEEEDLSSSLARGIESIVRLEKYPKSVIEINILVLEDDGSSFSSALTCASLALADAGIELKELLAGCSVAIVNSELLLDPTHEEEEKASGIIVVSFLATSASVSTVYQTGQFDVDGMNEAVKLSISGSNMVIPVMRNCLKKRHTKELKEASLKSAN